MASSVLSYLMEVAYRHYQTHRLHSGWNNLGTLTIPENGGYQALVQAKAAADNQTITEFLVEPRVGNPNHEHDHYYVKTGTDRWTRMSRNQYGSSRESWA